ncbi:hypothetical protein B0H65DRAFT_415586 [Neurospora tetraspora]|uniref:Uncharacterized protein n=1 Tax=Neurospora tetraspora TaxID=94610 RepID=A0AAE0JN74_9PEZI|nr:hypothetical protein B0H65DRAFT_415586 [Neurospora tetraspora]
MWDLWFDIVEESELMEDDDEPVFFGPPRPPAWFHWVAGHGEPPVFPAGLLPIGSEFQVDDLLWDGAFLILPQGPVPEPRDVDDSSGPFWAPPSVTPRQHHFLPREHRTRDEDELSLQMLEEGTAENRVIDPLDNLLLDRPPWAPDFPPPPRATIRDVVNLVESEPPLPPPGWQTALTLLRPWFHEAPWRLEPVTHIPEHIIGQDELGLWVDDAVEVLIRRNRTLLQFINFDIRQEMTAALDVPRA